MGETKKVRTTGRFGPRYGVGIRKRVLKVEQQQRQKFQCPHCGFRKVKRKAKGIYVCGKCGKKIAGGAYVLSTMGGDIIRKMVAQKKFVSGLGELTKSREKEREEREAEKERKKAPEKKEKSIEQKKRPEKKESGEEHKEMRGKKKD